MLFFRVSSPYWVDQVTGVVSAVLFLAGFVVAVWAFVHAATQRGDAFVALGTLTKATWLGIIGGTAVASLFIPMLSTMLALICLTASLVYLLDIRPAIREILGGH
jgi:Gpi18-like mannosyltransferase